MAAKNVVLELVTTDPYLRRLAGEGLLAPEVQCVRSGAAWTMNKTCQIERVASHTPRAAYLSQGQGNGGIGDYYGWLVEPARTNFLLQSNPNAVTPTGWSAFSFGGSVTATLTSAFGLNAIRFNVTSTGRRAINANVSLTAVRTYCISVYVNLDTFTGSPSVPLLHATGFSGATLTGTPSVANADADGRVIMYLTTSFDSAGIIWVGPGAVSNATPGIYEITGWQCEEVPDTSCKPSSLIVTSNASVTRNAEKLVIDGEDYTAMDLIGAGYSPLVLQGENRLSNTVSSTVWAATDGTINEQMRLAAIGHSYTAEIVTGGVVQRTSDSILASAGDRVTVTNSIAQIVYVNNVLQSFVFGGTMPSTLDRLEIGSTPNGEAHFVIRDLFVQRDFGYYGSAGTSPGYAKDGSFTNTTKVSLFPVLDDQHLPRLLEAPEYRVDGGCWLWGSRTQTQVGDALIANPDGVLNELLRDTARGATTLIKVGGVAAPYADYETVASVEIDAVKEGSSGEIVISFASPDIRLCEFINQKIYATSPNSNIVGDPRPITLGRCRQVEAVEYDPSNLTYHVHDQIVDGTSFTISEVQSNGNPASALDWAATDYGFDMNVTPSGKVTAYISQGVYGNTTREIVEGVLGANGAYTRGKFINYDASELQAITDDFSNPIAGMFINEATTVKDALHWFLDPFVTMVYVDATGTLRFTRLEDPAGGTSVLTITPENFEALTWPAREDDSMPGLTGRFSARKNWSPIARESAAGALSLNDQATVASEYRLHSTIGRAAFGTFYTWASEAPALETGLDEQGALDAVAANVQALAGPFVGKRQRYRTRVVFEELPVVRIGQVVTIEAPEISPAINNNSHKFQVVGVRYRFGGNSMEFTLWA